MHAEHCERRDSDTRFESHNYGTSTTSELEYHFVLEPLPSERDHERTFEVVDASSSKELSSGAWPSAFASLEASNVAIALASGGGGAGGSEATAGLV